MTESTIPVIADCSVHAGRRWPKLVALVVISVFAVELIAWSVLRAPRFAFPEGIRITQIRTRFVGNHNAHKWQTIDDPAAIEQFVGFVDAHSDGWFYTWDTRRNWKFQISLQDGNQEVASFYLGEHHIAYGTKDLPERNLSEAELALIQNTLGISLPRSQSTDGC